MSSINFLTRICFVCLVAFPAAAWAQEKADLDVPYLFVQSATGGSLEGASLKLDGVSSTIFFSDRPHRVSGHMGTDKFVEDWAAGDDSFKSDPPNATLSVLDGGQPVNAVIELFEPILEGGVLTYQVKVADGEIPAKFAAATLFIDSSSKTGWGVAGGLVGGVLLNEALSNKHHSSTHHKKKVVYVHQPPRRVYYQRAAPQPCY